MNIKDRINIEITKEQSELLDQIEKEILGDDGDYGYMDVLCKDWSKKDLAHLVVGRDQETDDNFDNLICAQLSEESKSAIKEVPILFTAMMGWAKTMALPAIAETLAEFIINIED
jgi:hypothetical protein